MERVPDLTGSRKFALALLEAVPDTLLVVDAKGRIVVANLQAEKMFGYARDALLGQPIELLIPERFRASHVKLRSAYSHAPATRAMGAGPELVARRQDGSEFPIDIALSPLDSEYGRLTIAIARDLTKRKETEEKLRYLSGHDALTGAYNRYTFEDERSRLDRGRRFPVSIMVVDLDSLKETNDLSGHAAGDEMLKRAAAVLAQAFRAEETIARVGGDEFAVLLPSTGPPAALAAVERVRSLVSKHNAETPAPALSLSIGVATAKRGESLTQCFNEADRAMYRDKMHRAGRSA
jgi:diguanylate cyclase (GGDEF)-like protein/PAS domain S-box-containing protein